MKTTVSLYRCRLDPITLACNRLDFTGGWHSWRNLDHGNAVPGDIDLFPPAIEVLADCQPSGWLAIADESAQLVDRWLTEAIRGMPCEFLPEYAICAASEP